MGRPLSNHLELETESLDILGMGGIEHLSIRLAQLRHRVLLADSSQDMLAKAREAVARHGLEENVTMVCSSVQDLTFSKKCEGDVCIEVLDFGGNPL